MKTITDIKISLYEKRYESSIPATLRGAGINLVPYESEEELGRKLKDLQSRYDTKEVLILKPFKGRVFQACPGSPGMICCNYLLLNTSFGCLYDCTYCFLLSYLNSFGILQFFPIEEMFDNIEELVPPVDGMVRRIGTGEFTDSLMMDELTGISSLVMEKFIDRDDLFLEFKTKSHNIDHLLHGPRHPKTVLAWSLNTDYCVTHYEKDSATLDERLAAARKSVDNGFLVAFHFDPIIMYEGYLPEYQHLAERVMEEIDPSSIAWISMGCFRHVPSFKDAMGSRFPHEDLSLGEMFPGVDGKMRYMKDLRVEIYREMFSILHQEGKGPFIYLCMETGDVWHESLGFDPGTSSALELMLSDHLKKWF